jgi:outer membrane cobalamin receptor
LFCLRYEKEETVQRLLEATIICFLLIAGGTASMAQEAPHRLDSIVVTGARIGTPLIDTPANISVITKDDIEESGIRSLPELFKGEPGVFPTSIINNPKQSTVDIRGYGETAPQNVLFLVDGRRVNSIDLSGPDLAQIPIDMITRVRVFRAAQGNFPSSPLAPTTIPSATARTIRSV